MCDTGGGPNGDGSHPRDGWGIQEYENRVLKLEKVLVAAISVMDNTVIYDGTIYEGEAPEAAELENAIADCDVEQD